MTWVPEDFRLHPSVARVIEARKQMAAGKLPVDWGMAETLAYASLLSNGYDVRLSGQDSARGTFAHRHAVLHDQDRERWDQGSYVPLQNIGKDQGNFVVIDSVLSEEAVLGFEYGFATAEPNALVIWEAQFGDFVNGAQVVIDQFISSGETKWGRVCGLTLFLPHGYEGQGPEHSSARLERFLQLCAEHNMQVCVPTTAAQIFHLLRRQMLRPFRKPLVVFTPKSLLRKKEASSPIAELANGSFHTVIPDGRAARAEGSEAHRRLQRQGLLRPDLEKIGTSANRCCGHPHRAALSVPAQAVRGRDEALSERCRSGVVPGGAAEPGRVVSERPLLAPEHARGPEAVLCRPPGFRRARERLHGAP